MIKEFMTHYSTGSECPTKWNGPAGTAFFDVKGLAKRVSLCSDDQPFLKKFLKHMFT